MTERELTRVILTEDENGKHHIVKEFTEFELTTRKRKSGSIEYCLARGNQPIERINEREFIITGSRVRLFTSLT